MSNGSGAGTLAERLQRRRRRTFVGRAAEVELFEAALDAEDAPFAVLFLHGPGGVGKTMLVEVLAERARHRGAHVVRLDGRDLLPSPDAVLAALAARPAGAGGERLVLVVDAYERLGPLDRWVRSSLLPGLPASTITVLAGRARPAPAWHDDPAWRELCRVVAVRNLGPDECRSYLDRLGVAPADQPALVAASHGHPLALSLLADLVLQGRPATVDPLNPELVAILLRRFVDAVPSPLHRRALEVCALARVTTEDLLRHALGLDDAHDLFDWLRQLSFVEVGAEGLAPHDLARDVLDVDLRWRDPDTYRTTFRRVRDHIHRRLGTLRGRDQQRAIFDEKFVFRNLPSVLSPVDWEAWGACHPQPAGPEDRGPVLDLVARAEGPASAAIAARWWDLQPEAFHVVRDDRTAIRGVVALVRLDGGGGPAVALGGTPGGAGSSPDLGFDPGATAAWEYGRRQAPPRPGEVVTQTRFVVDRDRYQAPSPTLNAVPILTMQHYLQTPQLAWDFVTLADPDPFDDYFALADLPRAEGADFTVGGRRYGLFAHDFRRVPVDRWLEVVTERALAQAPPPPVAPATTEALVLSQVDFTQAVKQALRDLTRPDRLARNPLRRARVVLERAGTDEPAATTAALAEVVGEAVDSLQDHPRDRRRWRALDRTYRHPAATQERAAEALGLPFSTYRRHLAEGTARVVDALWDRELYGTNRPGVGLGRPDGGGAPPP